MDLARAEAVDRSPLMGAEARDTATGKLLPYQERRRQKETETERENRRHNESFFPASSDLLQVTPSCHTIQEATGQER